MVSYHKVPYLKPINNTKKIFNTLIFLCIKLFIQ